MATSGRPTVTSPRLNIKEHGRRRSRAWWGLAAALLVALVTGGCAAPSFRMGTPPKFERLGELKAGVSTRKDVVAVLGQPQGRGATRSQTYDLKEAWLYESMDLEAGKGKMRMLMIFLDKDTGVYHGHMWMASGYLFGRTE